MSNLLSQTQQWQPALHPQGDRKILALLLVQLEETEEQIDSLEQFRTALLNRITNIQQQGLTTDQQESQSSQVA
ncbi:MAG: hypothetical protein SFY66_24800 [Oculatellaceae cyanobacterium bins.114]|nr:hypothetical protein [Oculatellaceae cyanobacterium bins.114]